MDDARFAEAVRKELGDGTNPFYVAEILKKDIPDLLRWLQENNLGAISQVAQETLFHAEAHQEEQQDEDKRRVLHFGVRILETKYRLGLFLLQEIKRRLEVVDASAEQTPELPAGESSS